MTTPAEKKIKNFLKYFFKINRHFKVTTESENCDAILIFDKTDTQTYHVVMRNELNKTKFPEQEYPIEVIYLKNKNPHDSRKVTRGLIMRQSRNACPRNYVG